MQKRGRHTTDHASIAHENNFNFRKMKTEVVCDQGFKIPKAATKEKDTNAITTNSNSIDDF